jgi:hypothetical protein
MLTKLAFCDSYVIAYAHRLDVVPPSAPALAGNDNVESQLRRRLAERIALVKYKYGTSADLLDDGKRGLI